MKEILLIGAGGHCLSCIDVIESEKKFKIVGLIDNKNIKIKYGYRVYAENSLKKFSKRLNMLLLLLVKSQIQKLEKNYLKKFSNMDFKFLKLFHLYLMYRREPM